MWESKNNETIAPDKNSQIKFFTIYEESFQIFDSTIIGVESSKKEYSSKTIIMEDFQGNNSGIRIRFGFHLSIVTTLLKIEKRNCLFAGDNGGKVIQYILHGDSGRVKKIYKNLQIGKIYSSAYYKNIVVFGGNEGKLTFIDIDKRLILLKSFEVAPEIILTLKFCIKNTFKKTPILLAVNGEFNDYSNFKTDLLNVGHLFIENSIKNN